jgi:metallo-beta-lactamase family protein
MAQKIAIQFCGGVGTPTGSNFLFEEPTGKKVLIDCGFLQGKKVAEDENREPFLFDPKTIDALFVTHAHIDHVGRIPKLVHDGFKGVIYSTPPTRDIAELMLMDSMGVLSKEALHDEKEPIYTEADVRPAMALWQGKEYHQPITVGDASFVLRDAGHILGSSMVEITVNGKKILFTGDLGNSPAPLLRDTEKITDIDYLVMESVYGDRNHEDRDIRKNLLEDAIEDVVKSGGVLMIPAFSLERTQELLYELNDLVEHGRIPEVPVFIDSPLAINVTAVYKKFQSYFNAEALRVIKTGDDIFKFKGLRFTLATEDSKAIRDIPAPKVILAGSGMSNGGRIIHHEKNYLSDPKSTLLIIGYQVPGSLGRVLQDGEKNVRILGEDITVNAKVKNIHGYSAHKDSEHLVEFVSSSADSLKKVFVVLGEPKASSFLAQRLRDYLGLSAVIPNPNERVEIEV